MDIPIEPSEEARQALEEARIRRREADKLMAEADAVFAATRGHLERNHIADKIKFAMFGGAAA